MMADVVGAFLEGERAGPGGQGRQQRPQSLVPHRDQPFARQPADVELLVLLQRLHQRRRRPGIADARERLGRFPADVGPAVVQQLQQNIDGRAPHGDQVLPRPPPHRGVLMHQGGDQRGNIGRRPNRPPIGACAIITTSLLLTIPPEVNFTRVFPFRPFSVPTSFA